MGFAPAPGGPFKPAFGLSGGKGDGCPMSARCWQTWDSATPTGNPPGCPTLVDPILERQGGSGDGCPMSARRWQTWDSATPTTKTPGCPMSARRWQTWDSPTPTGKTPGAPCLPAVGRHGIPRPQQEKPRVPHVCPSLADMGFRDPNSKTPGAPPLSIRFWSDTVGSAEIRKTVKVHAPKPK